MIFLIFNFHPTFSPLLSFQIFIYLLLWVDGRLCYYFLFICFTINRKGFVNQRVAKPTKVISHVFYQNLKPKIIHGWVKIKEKYFYFVFIFRFPRHMKIFFSFILRVLLSGCQEKNILFLGHISFQILGHWRSFDIIGIHQIPDTGTLEEFWYH